MANQPLAFAELLGGGVLLTAALTGASVRDVIAGNAGPFKGFSLGNSSPAQAEQPGQAEQSATPTTPGGTTVIDGKPVANWIVPAINYARAHGWTGSVTSGQRTYQEQAQLYQNYLHGGNIAAPPGQSNHEGAGAIDVTDPYGFAHALAGYNGPKLIQGLGIGDPVHFSGNGR